MTCCILEKRMATTVIPGNPDRLLPQVRPPSRPTAQPHLNERICEWYRNDQITWTATCRTSNGVPATHYGLVGGAESAILWLSRC